MGICAGDVWDALCGRAKGCRLGVVGAWAGYGRGHPTWSADRAVWNKSMRADGRASVAWGMGRGYMSCGCMGQRV